ncbi:hippocampus abundant transcript 1 protein-like [Sipha flava]|uniref:Hippocampus abundant transcript 1 protein-like n=1 Tax=Sipha flava TaxID=143950 RepID=A0A8B8G7E5_9HEMI|nr:hippocampus abundant transcript 1 protein-like [Sipha flava]XP_025418515.1 hippocampus abundant transcript 1 protein-like [Sipha flava]XP_025418516.1 hippocampus abundant transcript 1 protein-like [Sipha flava]XP_025418517.1 hippocampus abundant transcript 1 protein-like [Sipha flava]XP_025418518.1 hippocampus abundant transcript 1 protein-like [Sipha flava]XP_025418519.1 hippocampus abundant transcript 1 protein-like [Sipha flava]XP_025418521.1 hippocampus abundant transcript 1 protein-li
MSTVKGVMANVSVEPVVFLYFVTMVFSGYLSTNLLLYKACDPTGAMAQLVGSKCPDEAKAQHVVAPINGYKLLVQQVVPVALAMFAGTWSDRHGRRRRPLVLLPIIGQILSDALSLYCTVRWSVSPAVTATMQAAAIACSGGPAMLFNGINSYVADKTAEEWRTVKYGMIGGVISVGCILGMLVYGSVIVNVGFAAAYQISIGLGLLCLALAFGFMDDAELTPSDKLPLYRDVLRTINPMEVLRNSYGVLTKRRQGNDTVILCIVVLLCAPLTCIPLEGEMSVMYLFLRYKFQWNEEQFSVFNAYQMTVVLIGTIFALGILSHKFRMDDALIGTIAAIFDLLCAIAFFLVTQSWQLYIVPPLELFRGAALSLTSSIASKCVGPTELGAMNSVKLLMESSLKSGFLPFYNFMYNHTFESMPGAFFLISIALTAPLVFSFGYIYYIRRKQLKSTPNLESINGITIQKTEIIPIDEPTDITSHI